MAPDVTVPRLSASMEEGTILKWIVWEGGEVKRGEPLCEIETDKANMTYEADTDGVLIEIVVPEGETVELGEVIARIGEPGEAGGSGEKAAEEGEGEDSAGHEEQPAAEEAEDEPEREPEPATASGNGSASGSDSDDERAKASPVARRVANELGIDIADVQGTGPGGRILKADVEQAAAEDGGAPEKEEDRAPAPKAEKKKDKKPKKDKKKKEEKAAAAEEKPEKPEPAGDAGNRGEMEVQELTRLQRTVSRRMAESKATAPDFALEVEVDMSLCVELRQRLKEVEDKPPSFNDMVVKACA